MLGCSRQRFIKLQKLQPCLSRPCQLTWGLVRLLCCNRGCLICKSLSVCLKFGASLILGLVEGILTVLWCLQKLSFSERGNIKAAIAPFL